MDIIIKFFRSKKTEFGFSFAAPLYFGLLCYVAWLTFAFFLSPNNGASLFFFYVCVNVLFCAANIYARKQIILRFFSVIMPLPVLVMLVYSFENRYLFVPPLVVCAVTFFAARTGEGLKMGLGTLYIVLFVLATVGYLILSMLTIPIRDVNFRERQSDYIYSPGGKWRVVKYVEEKSGEYNTVRYFIEDADADVKLPFLNCMRVYGSEILFTTKDVSAQPIKWDSEDTLYVDGRKKRIS